MKRLIASVLAIAWAVSAQAQEARCPWQQDDPTDEVGASRTQTPENVLESIRLVRTGEIFRLGHVYDEVTLGTPPFGRVFDVTVAPFSFPDEEDNSQSFYSGGVRASDRPDRHAVRRSEPRRSRSGILQLLHPHGSGAR